MSIAKVMEAIGFWLFRHLFPGEYDHMRHLIDDVIYLEEENKILREKLAGWEVSHNYSGAHLEGKTTTNAVNGKTYWLEFGK